MNFLESSIKLDVYGSNIIFDHLELIDNSLLSPGLESDIKIYLKNTGSIDLNDVQLNLLHSGYSIDIIQDIVDYEYIYAGQVSEPSSINARVLVDSNVINGSVINLLANIVNIDGYNQDIIIPLNIDRLLLKIRLVLIYMVIISMILMI